MQEGRKLDAELKKMMAQNPRISVMTAAVLAALDHLDESVTAQESTDNMRLQIKDYLEDAAKARIECEEQKREIERLRREKEREGLKVGSILFEESAFREAAHDFFARLRDLDQAGVDLIIAGALSGEDQVGFAVMNRMVKSAGYNIIKV